MEDGLDLLRAWLRPDVIADDVTPTVTGPTPRGLEAVLMASLARSRAFGARDVDIRVGVDQATGCFTEVVIQDLARGVSSTRLRAWLTDGIPPMDPGIDWTLPELNPPLGPPGFALTRFRTHHAGQTIESWVLPDGTWELHLHSGSAPGNRETWYLPSPGPRETLERLRTVLHEGLSPIGTLQVRLQGELVRPDLDDPPLQEIRRTDDATKARLELLAHPDGSFVLSHCGLVFSRGPSPIPHLRFAWDGVYHPGRMNPGTAVALDLEKAQHDLGERLIEKLTKGEALAEAWIHFLAGHPDPAWRLRTLGKDLRGRSFSTLDLVQGTVLAVNAAATFPPVGPEFRLLDERTWSTPALHKLQRQEMCLTRSLSNPGQAARRVRPAAAHPCAKWPSCWEREAARDSRLAFVHGIAFCELHRPDSGAWPFFPAEGSVELVRLRMLPGTWDLRGALWVAINHPVVKRLASHCVPADAVRLLATLVLLSQDQEPTNA